LQKVDTIINKTNKYNKNIKKVEKYSACRTFAIYGLALIK